MMAEEDEPCMDIWDQANSGKMADGATIGDPANVRLHRSMIMDCRPDIRCRTNCFPVHASESEIAPGDSMFARCS